jgi:hypothetical protein
MNFGIEHVSIRVMISLKTSDAAKVIFDAKANAKLAKVEFCESETCETCESCESKSEGFL